MDFHWSYSLSRLIDVFCQFSFWMNFLLKLKGDYTVVSFSPFQVKTGSPGEES